MRSHARHEFNIPKASMQEYLSKREGRKVRITEYFKLGSGWHGSGYMIAYRAGAEEKKVVLRTINPIGFSHDHPSDRAAVFIMQNELFNSTPKHVRSIDVGGLSSKGGLISVGDLKEFFQIVLRAKGVPYVNDLDRIAKDDKLRKGDIERAGALSDYLARLHKKKFGGGGDEERSMRLRHLRDAVGSGEMLMGVLDTYPPKTSFAGEKDIEDIVCRSARFARRIRETPVKISRLHGDFHPGNIWFDDHGDFTLLDASRERWGLAADDLTALSINYIWYAVKMRGKFEGPFKELFLAFWNNYLAKTGDRFLDLTAAPFFAFRGVVVAHPLFYPRQSDSVRRKIFAFIQNILSAKSFDPGKINSYLEVK